MDLDRLYKNFDVLPDWQDRYRFIIDLGKKIPKLDESLKTDENQVHGCMSTVHMVINKVDDTYEIIAESDALIVNGLIAVLLIIYSGKTLDEIKSIDMDAVFSKLGLEKHISPNRRNGFFSMVERIKKISSPSL